MNIFQMWISMNDTSDGLHFNTLHQPYRLNKYLIKQAFPLNTWNTKDVSTCEHMY